MAAQLFEGTVQNFSLIMRNAEAPAFRAFPRKAGAPYRKTNSENRVPCL